jgi:DNA-binding NarL/FixJ family response regulator
MRGWCVTIWPCLAREKLFLSPKTVETHVNSIFTKLGLAPEAEGHRRVLAVLAFLRS